MVSILSKIEANKKMCNQTDSLWFALLCFLGGLIHKVLLDESMAPKQLTASAPPLRLFAEHPGCAASFWLQSTMTILSWAVILYNTFPLGYSVQCRSCQSVRAYVVFSPHSAEESPAAVFTHLLGASQRHRQTKQRCRMKSAFFF